MVNIAIEDVNPQKALVKKILYTNKKKYKKIFSTSSIIQFLSDFNQ